MEENDVVIITAGYKVPFVIGKVVNAFHEQERGVFKKLKRFNFVKHYDKFIAELSEGAPFIAYIDLMHYYQRILVSHPLCSAFHFMEEGTASYQKPNSLNDLTVIELNSDFRAKGITEIIRGITRIARGYTLKLLAMPYYGHSYSFIERIRYYAFSYNAFPAVIESKKVLLSPNYKGNELKIPGQEPLTDSIILVEESFFNVYKVGQDETTRVLRNSIIQLGNFRKDYKGEIYLKLRPNQLIESSIWVKSLENEKIPYTVMTNDVILEYVLSMSNHCLLMGTVSSLLYYGSLFGHRSISNYGIININRITPFDNMEFYWDKVEKLSRKKNTQKRNC